MLRLILSPRWILWHLLTIGAVVTCGLLSAWQWGRAGSAMGSALNVGYGLQWPLFALFFGYMWFRFLRLEIHALREGEGVAGSASPDGAADTGAGPETPAARAGLPGAADPEAGARRSGVADAAVEAGPARSGVADDPAPSPFGPRPHAAPPITDETDPELAAYNRMLAALAERDRARS